VEQLGQIGGGPLTVRQAPNERGRAIQPVGRVRLLIVDDQFLADLLRDQLLFSRFRFHACSPLPKFNL
jgi:hypothetical protein